MAIPTREEYVREILQKPFTGGQVGISKYFDQMTSGKITPVEFMQILGYDFGSMSSTQEKIFNNLLSQFNTQQARDYETGMANTDLLRAASQLSELGLSPSNVYQTGGSATPNVSAANADMSNLAERAKARQFERETQIANSLISMAGRMASSGIYGSALQAVKGSASRVAALSAHSVPRFYH